ncbi:MAG: Na/Pi cotransporter family protein, partial [Planctomycetota bacterium]|nr:Na/Pi cotransporter family protein [Planctomycetota bacterium]
DYILDLDKFERKLRKEGERFTEAQRADLAKLNSHVAEYLAEVNTALATGNKAVTTKTDPTAKRIRDEIKQLRQKHLAEMSTGTIAPVVMVAWLASLNAYSKVREHTREIAEAISEAK